MCVYKRAGKSPYYAYDFQRGNQRFHGSTGETDRRRAEAIEKKIRAEVEEAFRKGRLRRGRVMTFDSAAGRYWDEVGQHCEGSARLDNEIARLVEAVGAETPITAITDQFVAKLVANRRTDFVRGDPKRGRISNSQVNRSTTQLLRRILTRARKVWKQALPEEPNWAAHMLPEPRERVRELRYDEEEKLEKVERDDYRAPRLFAQMTGLRRREVAGLTWDQVDFAAETISVVGKGDKPHVLPITDELRDLLQPLVGHHPEAVFTYAAMRTGRNGRDRILRVKGVRYPITYEGLATHLGRGFDKAGLKGFRVHDLRHTAATRTLRATGNLRVVQQLLAHASPVTTAKYAHANLEDLRSAMSATVADSSARRDRLAGRADVVACGSPAVPTVEPA